MNIFEKYPNSEFLKGLPKDSDLFSRRERIVELFRSLDGLEDPDFASKPDKDPHALLWEMVLATILKSEGYEPRRTTPGPDFLVERGTKRIFVEAICPGAGAEDNPNSVPPIRYNAPIAQDVPETQIVLRIRGALEEKKRQYDRYLEQRIVSDSDVCNIAVNSSKIDGASGLWPPAIMRATHGLGNPYVLFGQGKGFIGEGIESRESIPKVSGTDIDTMFFLSEVNSLISGVLYSDRSCFSLTFDLFGKSMFIHNPKARALLPLGFFKRIKEWWTICCHDTPQWRAYQISNALICGSV